jgi:hypothetical protein
MGMSGPGVKVPSALAVELVGGALEKGGFDKDCPEANAMAILEEIKDQVGRGLCPKHLPFSILRYSLKGGGFWG